MKPRSVTFAGLCVTLGLATGCGPEELGDPTYEGDIQAIWDAKCTVCHVAGGEAEDGPDLSAAAGAEALVGVMSLQAVGVDLVAPNDPANSYLIAKLRKTHLSLGGNGGSMPPMPLDPLSEADISRIEEWIELGAPF